MPPSTIRTVRLVGVPTEPGCLTVRGCLLELTGCPIQEFVLPITPATRKSKEREWITCEVVSGLPVLSISPINLVEGALMVLEGEV